MFDVVHKGCTLPHMNHKVVGTFEYPIQLWILKLRIGFEPNSRTSQNNNMKLDLPSTWRLELMGIIKLGTNDPRNQ
jgi:hypothetical protein